MNVVIPLGPPGAGKRTQVARIDERLSTPVIFTGEVFRSNMAEDTKVGKQAKLYMGRGEFIPDPVTNTVAKARLPVPSATQGFLLDGYPHNIEQTRVLVGFCGKLGTHTGVVLETQAGEGEVIVCMLKRAEKQHRADDNESVIRHRLEAYHEQTKPVASFYVDLDLPETVDGSSSINEVSERIFTILDVHLGR